MAVTVLLIRTNSEWNFWPVGGRDSLTAAIAIAHVSTLLLLLRAPCVVLLLVECFVLFRFMGSIQEQSEFDLHSLFKLLYSPETFYSGACFIAFANIFKSRKLTKVNSTVRI